MQFVHTSKDYTSRLGPGSEGGDILITGGRMCTSSSPDNPNCTADLGAQYVTATSYHRETHGRYLTKECILLK